MSRTLAIRALVRIEDGAYANVVLPALLRASDLPARDRAQVTEWVYGTVRMQRALDYQLGPCLDRPLAKLDPPVRAGLRLGAYQLTHGIAAHAAVGETVAAMGKVSPRAKGFVNAVLRKFSRSGPPWSLPTGEDVESIATRASMPNWIVDRLVADLGAVDTAAALAAVNEPGVVTLRVNRQRATPDAVEQELVEAGIAVVRGALLADDLLVTGTGDIRALPAVRDGRATPQDQASHAVAQLVGAQPGERILEVGAAPGGKTSALAEAMGDDGLVVGLDRNVARTRMVGEGADRLGLNSVTPIVADGMELPFRGGSFDRVLVDAPCSGLGVLRRRPEARWRLEPATIDQLARIQPLLLEAASRVVRPGGVLVYSVCTLTRAETVAVDEWAVTALPGWESLPPPSAPWAPVGRGARLLPSAAGTDGMYILSLRCPL
ncbi:MAG: 16S rRNA (cytosine(967)-C(5))-methyltransferase RsmB [Acidimicrobiia bacterium]|nr:16S rRNA (cytosine(967)-C(5))-methyltransferase RsmB [Acidimicrobiia bacterium]